MLVEPASVLSPRVLDRVRVLELVDEDVAEAVAVVIGEPGPSRQSS
jgi:hypothetical protein